ncbi:MAG: thiamine pyrophosphate-dependent enzyme [Anaerolineae bacterium]
MAPASPFPLASDLRTAYLRQSTAFCPGCGHGIFMNAFLRAAAALPLDFDRTVFVSGIGCGAWVPSPHFLADTLHVTHGRAVAFAAGVQRARPDLNVVVISGDGDLANIGGNHLIHAARRQIPIKVFCLNNWLFGMTGGQVSATTPRTARTATTPAGNPDPPFDLVRLVLGAGAPFAARWPVSQPRQLSRGILHALQEPGFAFVEVLSICPTHFGRANEALLPPGEASQTIPWRMLEWLRLNCVERGKAAGLPPEERAGKILIGEWRGEEGWL